MHGHTHESGLHWIDPNVPILSTGSAAVTVEWRPEEAPNQYQVLRLHPDHIERYTRCYDPGQKRWIGDNRGSEHGDGWITDIPVEFQAVSGLFPGTGPRAPDAGGDGLYDLRHPGRDRGQLEPRRDDLLSRVEEVCRLRQRNAQVTRVQTGALDYFRVTETDGAHCHLYPVGVADRGLTAEYLGRFVAEVHRPYRGADPGVISRIVYPATDRPPRALIDEAGRHGVRVMSLIEYQGLIDFGPYLERQTRGWVTIPSTRPRSMSTSAWIAKWAGIVSIPRMPWTR